MRRRDVGPSPRTVDDMTRTAGRRPPAGPAALDHRRVRDQVAAAGRVPALQAALALSAAFGAGLVDVLTTDADGWTLYEAAVADNEYVVVWLPPDVLDEAYAAARAAVIGAACSSCVVGFSVGVTLDGRELVVAHEQSCACAAVARER